jgi:hypothetical protein
MKVKHFSPKPDITELDPDLMGSSGVRSVQLKRAPPKHKTSFFYTQDSKPESIVQQSSPHEYEADLSDHNIYDLDQDSNNYIQEVKNRNQGVWSEDTLHDILKEKGHGGVAWSQYPETKVVQTYNKVPVKKIGEDLEKSGSIKGILAAQAAMGAMALGGSSLKQPQSPAQEPAKIEQVQEQKPIVQEQKPKIKFSDKMLRAIAQVESSGGKNVSHQPLSEDSIHQGTRAIGKFGLTPVLIQETVNLNKDLGKKYPHIKNASIHEVEGHMSPEIEKEIAKTHLQRLRTHFGDNPAAIGMAWLNGITGTKRAISQGKNLEDHWHVKKILGSLDKIKQSNDLKKARVDSGKTIDQKISDRYKRKEDWERENYGMISGHSPDLEISKFKHRAKLRQIQDSPIPKLTKSAAPKIPAQEPIALEEKAPLTVKGKQVQPNPHLKTKTKAVFENGVLHTPRGSFQVKTPSLKDQDYQKILNSSDIQDLHQGAMHNWMKLNNIVKSGQKLPKEIVAHANLFSILSANTPVPQQELMYSRLVDTMKDKNLDPTKPEFSGAFDRGGEGRKAWLQSDSPTQLPSHSRSYWQGPANPAIINIADSKLTGRKAGEISPLGSVDAFSDRISKYPNVHDYIHDLVTQHQGNPQKIVHQMMVDKANIKNPKDHPMKLGVGLGVKTARYATSMMGGGQSVIPDTHFVRHLFGLDSNTDSETSDYIKQVLWDPKNHHILNSIDDHYSKTHPAVNFVTNKYFNGKKDPHSNFPAFWLHWLTIAPHEKSLGIGKPSVAKNLTDHTPYFDTANEILDKYGLNLKKSENNDSDLKHKSVKALLEMKDKLGFPFASMAYYAYILPMLAQEAAQKNIAINTLSPINKSENFELEKMSRPRITFPNIPKTSTRPDQEVQILETPRQKAIYGRKVAQVAYPDIVTTKVNPDGSKQEGYKVNRQSVREKEGQKAANVLGNRYFGVSNRFADLRADPLSAAIAGELRSKFEEPDDDYKKKLEDHKSKRNQIVRDYNQKVQDWRSKAYELSNKIKDSPTAKLEYEDHVSKRPQKPRLPRTPSKPKVQTQNLSRDAMALRGKTTDSTVEHEGLHHIFAQIQRHHGEYYRKQAVNKLLGHFDNESLKHVADFVLKRRYKRNSPTFGEEVLAHSRDILVNPKKRESFRQMVGHEKAKEIIKNLKIGHQKAYSWAKKATIEDLSPTADTKKSDKLEKTRGVSILSLNEKKPNL